MSVLSALPACGVPVRPREQAGAPHSVSPAPAEPNASQARSPTPGVVPDRATPTAAEYIGDHFIQALFAREAIIRGDMVAMRKSAAWLADRRLSETLPETWRPHVGDMQNAAKLAQQAGDLEVAADAVGAMGAACGRCHQALGAVIQLPDQSPEDQKSSVADSMMRHRWAEARMWEGLVGPSDLAWNAGVTALQDARLHPDTLAADRSPPQEVVMLADRVHGLAFRGKLTAGLEARSRLYGQLLSSCESCHAALGIRLAPPQ